MKYVVDASALVEGFEAPMGDAIILITPSVEREVRLKSLHMLEYTILEPDRYCIDKVVSVARNSGDLDVLSDTDIEVLALAYQEHAVLITDDYAMQNVAEHLGLKWLPVHQSGITKKLRWKWRCTGCGKYYSKNYGTCPVCGSKLRRVPK